MGVGYRLTLAGDIPLEQVAECAVPEPSERPRPSEFSSQLLSARLYDRYGFALMVSSGSNGYYDAEDDDGSRWEWEPDMHVNVDFAMGKDDRVEQRITNMLMAVARVLQCQPGDAALVLNGDVLLLARFGGVLRKHNRARWWDNYGFVNDIVPG